MTGTAPRTVLGVNVRGRLGDWFRVGKESEAKGKRR